jgi:hypothetical protein
MNENPTGPPLPRVLPVVADMCNRINGIFVRYVGPVAHELSTEIYETWREAGNTGPSGVTRYIQSLAQNVVDEGQRSSFREEALAAMRDALQRRS